MAKIFLRKRLQQQWEAIMLEAQRAVRYLEKDRVSKPVHKMLAKNVTKSANKIMKLTNKKPKPCLNSSQQTK